MPPKGKTKRMKPRKLIDRISDLPDNVIDLILSRVPLCDAVRTSTLSSKWRLHWTRIESLVLDSSFFDHVLDDNLEGEPRASTYANIVASILLSHIGPIREFFLHIPDDDDTPVLYGIDQCILSVSQLGVQDLTVEADPTCFGFQEFPSSVLQCVELKHLSVRFLVLRELPFQNFRNLSSLVSLELCCINTSGDVLTNIISNCPLLESLQLDLQRCNSFSISAPVLRLLSAKYYGGIDFILKNTPYISTLSLTEEGYPGKPTVLCQDIVEFFGAIPNVENTNLDHSVLAEWGMHGVPERLPALLTKHLSLDVCNIDLSLPQILAMFCIIKSSPGLRILDISAGEWNVPESDATKDYLRSQVLESDNAWSLRTVEVAVFWSREPVIVINLIQVILSCCPKLEKLYFKSCHTKRNGAAEFKMMSDIMRLPRASPKAEIIYSKSYLY